MIDIDEANRIIEEYTKRLSKSHKTKVIAKLVEEKEFGWIYIYNTEESFMAKNSLNILLGEGSLVINRNDSSLISVNLSMEEIIIGISVEDRYKKNKIWNCYS